jgi:hypothetical protein
MRIARVALLTCVVAGVTVVATAPPAFAHGVGGISPSDYETRVLSTRPRVAGVDLRVVDLGDRLELTNDTRRELVVYGYDEEPYLRVGPRGTFENVRSPAVYLNRTRRATGKVPKSADPQATPRWRKVSDSTTAQWHDHRAHWMGRDDPPVVQRDPDARHLVQRWTVQMTLGERVIKARGDVLWVPGPSPSGWVLGALALAAALLLVHGTRFARVAVAAALALLVVSEATHVAGTWGATTADALSKVGASAYSLGGLALAVVALVWVLRRGVYAATPLVLLAGLFVLLAGGLSDVTALGRSQLPATTPDWLVRAEVMLALGLGAGLAVLAGLSLRPSAALAAAGVAPGPAREPVEDPERLPLD